MLVWKITPLGEKEKQSAREAKKALAHFWLSPKVGQVLAWEVAFNQQVIYSKIISGLRSKRTHQSIFLSLYPEKAPRYIVVQPGSQHTRVSQPCPL